jgi:hypothetical protein
VCVCVCVCWCVWCACERLILVDDVTGRAGCSPCSQHRQAGASHTPSHASHTRYYYYTSLVNEISSVVTWLVAACTWRGAHRCPASPGTHRSKEKERFFFCTPSALPPSTPTPAHTPSAAHTSTRKPLHFGVPCVLGTRYDTSGAHHTPQPARSYQAGI